jgi:hypothetical protein
LKPVEVITFIKEGVTPVARAKKEIPLIDSKRTLGLLRN